MEGKHSTAKLVLLFIGIFVTAFVWQMTSVPASASASEPYIGKIPVTLKHDVHGNDARWAKIYADEKYGATYEVIDPDQDLNKEIAAA